MKPVVRKILILGGVFLVTLGIFLLVSSENETGEERYVLMDEERLPVVFPCVTGTRVDPLLGYAGEVDAGALLKYIVPLPAERALPIEIDTKGRTITTISYEIRGIADGSLIEGDNLSDWEIGENLVKAVVPIKDLIEKGEEYALVIKLTTENHSELNYYTRIMWNEDLKTEKMMETVRDLHKSAYTGEGADKYAVSWEVDDTVDSEQLAYVNIHSNFRQLTYRSMKPEETAEPQICILEMDKIFGSFLIKSEMRAVDEGGAARDYYVEEFICLQWSDQRNAQNAVPFYLMSYERHMTQKFRPQRGDLGAKGLNVGIAGESDVALMRSGDGSNIAFTGCGELWSLNAADGEFTQIYTLRADNSFNTDYGIKILEVADSGNIDFLVYGYMSRGNHEGMTGVSVFRYMRDTGELKELRFVNSETSYEIIEEQIERLSDKVEGRIFFLLDDTVFMLSESGDELLRMVEAASVHGLCVNDDRTVIAWMQGDDPMLAESIKLLYLSDGSSRTIAANDGEYVRSSGFIDSDLVYVAGRTEDVTASGLMNRVYPAYALYISAKDGSIAAEYAVEGIYISNTKVREGQVVLERMKRDGTGFTVIDSDVLLQNTRQEKQKEKPLSYEKTDLRMKVGSIGITGAENNQQIVIKQPGGISYFAGADRAAGDFEPKEAYYAYSFGRLKGIYERAGEAVSAVYEEMGSVTDNTGCRIWHRTAKDPQKMSIAVKADADAEGKPELVKLISAIFKIEGAGADAISLMEAGYSAVEALERGLGVKAVDLSGCNVKQLYLFLAKGSPVIAQNRDGEPVLITGYDASNIVVFDPKTGASSRVGSEVAELEFESGGRVFLSYLR